MTMSVNALGMCEGRQHLFHGETAQDSADQPQDGKGQGPLLPEEGGP